MKNIFLIVILASFFSSCSSLKISSSADKEIDISKSKTYSFFGWTEVNDMVDIDKKAIEKAFANELKQRGLTYQEAGGDLVVSLFIVVDKSSTSNRYNSYYGHGPYGFYQPSWGWGTGYAYGYGSGTSYAGVPYKESSYYKGTLVCDVFKRSSKKLAWQGVVSKAIKTDKKRDGDQAQIAARLMKSFPIEKIEDN